MSQIAFFLAALIAAIFLVSVFALPNALSIPFFILFLWLWWRGKRVELCMVLASLLVGFGAVEITLHMMSDQLFYRAQEKWSRYGTFYPHVRDTIHMPHGDLVAMSPDLKDALSEPRDVEFITDRLGFRNAQDYAGEPYVLVGDSFADGTDTTQDDIPAYQLNRTLGHQFYSIAYPSNPFDYEIRALRFLRSTKNNPQFIWFVFEGNDFQFTGSTPKIKRLPTKLEEFFGHFKIRNLPLLTPRFMAVLFKNQEAHHEKSEHAKVVPYDLAGKKIGFLDAYISAASAEKLLFLSLGNEEVYAHTACVVFVPDKYRVYKPWLSDQSPAISEPAAGLTALNEYFAPKHIPVIDATSYLQAAARQALKEHAFVYWQDDTHWNARGIASVIPAVKQCLNSPAKKP